MRLTSLHIQNFRSIQDSGDFSVKPMFAFVGENNAGKSNLLHSIEVLLSAGAGGLSRADFKESTEPIIIKGTFGELSDAERRRWRPYLVGDSFSLEKHISLTTDEKSSRDKLEAEFHGYQAEPEPWYLSIPKIQERHGERPNWVEIAREAGLPEYFFDDGRCNKAIYVKALSRFLF
jgi:predicted ATP-dependent endonuclease of OLD family